MGAVDPAGIYVERVFAGSDCSAGQRGPVCRICPSTAIKVPPVTRAVGPWARAEPAARSLPPNFSWLFFFSGLV